jgi:hypothetical protein
MNVVVRRSLEAGLLVAILLSVGIGAGAGSATARGTSAAAVSAGGREPVARHHQPERAASIVLPQYVIKRGPIGTVVDGVLRHVEALAPPPGMQPMPIPAARTGVAPAKSVANSIRPARSVSPAHPGRAVRAARPVRPVAATAACGCGARLTLGAPTVNARPAGNPPGAPIAAGRPAALTMPVTNSGTSPVTGLTSSSPLGGLRCDTATLPPGQTTTCRVTTTAATGSQTVPVTATGTGSLGEALVATKPAYYSGLAGGRLEIGTPTVNGVAAGANPGPRLAPGATAKVVVPVTNGGDASVRGVSGSSASGALRCADAVLAPGATTACTLAVVVQAGAHSLVVTIHATDPAEVVSATTTVHYAGNAPGAGPGGLGTTGQPLNDAQVSAVPRGAPDTGGGPSAAPGPHRLLLGGLVLLGLAGLVRVAGLVRRREAQS